MSLDQLLIDQGEAHIGMSVTSIVVMHDDWRKWADRVVYLKPNRHQEAHYIEITVPRTWWQRLLGRPAEVKVFVNRTFDAYWPLGWDVEFGASPTDYTWPARCVEIANHLRSVGGLPR